MKKLCCVFNYPPAYRESIFLKIDQEFDAQFMWAEEVEVGHKSDIKRLDYYKLKKPPIITKNKMLLGHFPWTTKMQSLPFKDYDAFIITGNGGISGIPFMFMCRLMGKPVYGWGHGHKKIEGKWKPIIKLGYKLINGFFTYGEGGKKRLIELGVPEKKLNVIYNSLCESVDQKERELCRSSEVKDYFGNELPTLFFVGRLTKVKQLDWLIKAKQYHNENGVHYNLLIIGDGPTGPELKQMVKDFGLDKEVWFYGECYDNNKLNTLLYNCDLCVSPGNVGLTALHSMMYGTPVLSHDDFETQMPEYETIVPGYTGMLYKHGSFDDFCAKITEWLGYGYDREMIRNNCFDMINGKWNSNYQIELIKKTINK